MIEIKKRSQAKAFLMKSLELFLQELNIAVTRYEHPAVFTCEQADQHCASIPGGKSKNLFIRNEKGDKHYLVVVEAQKRVNLHALAQQLHEKRLGFASPERLMRYLKLTPGSVSPFGLIHDTQKQVAVLVDNDLMLHDFVAFHPNSNTATLTIATSDFKKFLNFCGNTIQYLTIPTAF